MRNVSMQEASFELTLTFAADFADVISVKQHDCLGDRCTRRHCRKRRRASCRRSGTQLLLAEPLGVAVTRCWSAARPSRDRAALASE